MALTAGKKIKGGDMMLFINGKAIAFSTSHTLSIKAETKDTSNKDEGGGYWASNEVGLLSWSAKSENMYSIDGNGNNYDDLYDFMIKKTPITATFSKKHEEVSDVTETTDGWTASKPDYEGKVIITSLDLNAPNGDYATYSVEFTGVGELKHVTGEA